MPTSLSPDQRHVLATAAIVASEWPHLPDTLPDRLPPEPDADADGSAVLAWLLTALQRPPFTGQTILRAMALCGDALHDSERELVLWRLWTRTHLHSWSTRGDIARALVEIMLSNGRYLEAAELLVIEIQRHMNTAGMPGRRAQLTLLELCALLGEDAWPHLTRPRETGAWTRYLEGGDFLATLLSRGDAGLPPDADAYHLQQVTNGVHGRGLFAPLAAHPTAPAWRRLHPDPDAAPNVHMDASERAALQGVGSPLRQPATVLLATDWLAELGIRNAALATDLTERARELGRATSETRHLFDEVQPRRLLTAAVRGLLISTAAPQTEPLPRGRVRIRPATP